MGHTGLLIEEEPPMFRDTGDGKDAYRQQSGDNSWAKKKSPNASAGAGLLKDGPDGHACSQDTAEVPLACFLDLAQRQASVEPVTKRSKTTSTMEPKAFDVDSTMKHVADIVLVLAGLGLIRAGREPTHEERRLQAEAYGHLGFLVQELNPRDLVSPNSVENLIEDLGLRKLEDQEVKTFAQILESFQPPASMLQTDGADPAQNGTDAAFASMAQTTIDGRSLEEPDPHKFLLSASKMLHAANDDESDLHSQGEVSPSDSFAVENLGQKHADSAGSHKLFTQAIQDLLQPRYPADYPFQAAHSRIFMSAAMPCEMCKTIVKETVNVLVCDTCEKVFHLRCLQSYLMMGIPKGDWHCPKCTVSSEDSQERHQAPKYGRVKAGFSFSDGSATTVAKTPAKAPSNSQKTKQPASIGDGKSSKEAIAKLAGKISTATQKLDDQAPNSNKLPQKVLNHGSLGGSFTALLDSFAQADAPSRPGIVKAGQASNHQLSSHPQTSTRSAFLRSQVGQSSTPLSSQSQSHGPKGGRGAKVAGRDLQSKNTTEVMNPSSSPLVAGAANGSNQSKPIEESESLEDTSMGSEEEGDCDGTVKEADRFGIEWIGDIVHKNDGKNFYSACTVGGCLYRLQECALFRPETPNVPPYIARLQALWEDTNSGSKWVRVNWCYYPTDMAMLPGRPSNPEIHEVYESNHGDNNLVGTIQGQCLVLQPERYAKEMERRQELLKSGNTGEGLVPVFLCRWLYDVPTATFRPATEAP